MKIPTSFLLGALTSTITCDGCQSLFETLPTAAILRTDGTANNPSRQHPGNDRAGPPPPPRQLTGTSDPPPPALKPHSQLLKEKRSQEGPHSIFDQGAWSQSSDKPWEGKLSYQLNLSQHLHRQDTTPIVSCQQEGYEHSCQLLHEEKGPNEHDLVGKTRNLSQVINTMQEKDEAHLRRIGVLSERVMDSEAQIARQRSSAAEHESNCTELCFRIAAFHQELCDSRSRCAELEDQHSEKDARIEELQECLDDARSQSENLAISIENARMRHRIDNSRVKNSGGFFGRLMSFFIPFATEGQKPNEIFSPEAIAKSTLLGALQVERNSVDELEALVSSLHQNNSALSEMVKSRNLIIDELNDRVAVFEEDKVVLKAALKQLQKEMKKEAPITKKLMDDLKAARRENSRLSEDLESLAGIHLKEMNTLEKSIAETQNLLDASESKMTAIAHYVDTLEERLASLATVRMDVELREQKCREAEASTLQIEGSLDSMRTEIGGFELERSDLKGLLEQLVHEQSILRHENFCLVHERDELIAAERQSCATLASLDEIRKNRDDEAKMWKSTAQDYESALNFTRSEADSQRRFMEAAAAENEDLEKIIGETQRHIGVVQVQGEAILTELMDTKAQFVKKSSELEKTMETLHSTEVCLRARETGAKNSSSKAMRLEEQLKVQNAGIAKLPEVTELHAIKTSAANAEQLANGRLVVGRREQSIALASGRSLQAIGARESQTSLAWTPKTQVHWSTKRKVPFRRVRKFFSHTTGVHGAFTPRRVPAHCPPSNIPPGSTPSTVCRRSEKVSRSGASSSAA